MANSIFIGYFGTTMITTSGSAVTWPVSLTITDLTLGSSSDLNLSRVAARAMRLGPTTGVTLRWSTDGLLEVRNFANSAEANVTARDFRSEGPAGYNAAGSAGFFWNGSSIIKAPTNGQINFTNAAQTAGAGFDFGTDAILKVRTRAQTGYATIDALAYQASGVAGVSFSGAITNLTVVNGIVTAAS